MSVERGGGELGRVRDTRSSGQCPEDGPPQRTNDSWRAPWNNPWRGRADGAAGQRTLEDGGLGPSSGVRRAGRRDCGPHREVVGIHAAGGRSDRLARRRSRHVDGVSLVPARASRATTEVLVDADEAHPRHGPRAAIGPAVLMAAPFVSEKLDGPVGGPPE